MFHALVSRDHEDGRATGSTLAECGLKIYCKAREKQRRKAKSELLSSISSNQESEIRNPKSRIEGEAYLNGTSQGPTPEDPWKDGHIHGRSKRFMKHPG